MNAIVCVNSLNGIGFNNTIPWRSKKDMAYFKEKTIGKGNNAVIMGRKTFESMGCRPLKKRRNYILSRDTDLAINADVVVESRMENLIILLNIFDEVFVIGGNEIYELFRPYICKWYITHIYDYSPCDTFFTIDLSGYIEEEAREETDGNYELTFFVLGVGEGEPRFP